MLALRGPALSFRGDPWLEPADQAAVHHSDALVLVADGKIAAFGHFAALRDRIPADTPLVEYSDGLILPGFIDCHAHYPQLSVIASHGKDLLGWLESYTFPAEAKFDDPAVCRAAATLFLDECLHNGVTTAAVYGTVHPQSVDAFFEEAEARNLRMIAGKMLMDRNAPKALCESAADGDERSRLLIERWHERGRCLYAVTPRFAASSTPEQLELAGALWRGRPNLYLQSHLAETEGEVSWIARLFPDCPSYLAVYEKYGLLGERAIYGHGIHLADSDFRRLHETGTALAHCPTSNSFLGSGLFAIARAKNRAHPVHVGLASDVGAGTSLSPFATMAAAYRTARLGGGDLTPAQALYLATRGAAAALRLEDRIGSLAPGLEADLVVLDLESTPLIAHRMRGARDIWDALFAQMMLGDERATRAVYAAGRLVYDRDAAAPRPARAPSAAG